MSYELGITSKLFTEDGNLSRFRTAATCSRHDPPVMKHFISNRMSMRTAVDRVGARRAGKSLSQMFAPLAAPQKERGAARG